MAKYDVANCPDCQPVCQVAADDFDRGDSTDIGDHWSEDSGDWSTDTKQLVTTDSDAQATITTLRESDEWQLSASVQADTDGDSLGVLVGDLGGDYVRASILIDSSGDSTLAIDGLGSASCDFSGLELDTPYTLTLCVVGETAIASLGTQTIVATLSSALVSGQIGLATGTNSGTATFDDFTALRFVDGYCECEAQTCGGCKDGAAPPCLQLDFTGLEDDGSGLCGGASCTLYLPRQETTGCVDSCTWNCGGVDVEIGYDETDGYYVSVLSGTFYKAYGETKPDCMNFDSEEITLQELGNGVVTHCQTAIGSTCKITARTDDCLSYLPESSGCCGVASPDDIPDQVTVTLSGIVDQSGSCVPCDECDSLNGTYVLDRVADDSAPTQETGSCPSPPENCWPIYYLDLTPVCDANVKYHRIWFYGFRVVIEALDGTITLGAECGAQQGLQEFDADIEFTFADPTGDCPLDIGDWLATERTLTWSGNGCTLPSGLIYATPRPRR